jgi:hypothetical protein
VTGGKTREDDEDDDSCWWWQSEAGKPEKRLEGGTAVGGASSKQGGVGSRTGGSGPVDERETRESERQLAARLPSGGAGVRGARAARAQAKEACLAVNGLDYTVQS